ncbi:MFS transporter [Streptomyces iconiensis]|uniref:MFS transporter n=1 Tax=Streptomyces iconiensis TaxID=1384038 RepID=A0ABT6ZSE9_9ACTN|nr:MFS transporter [Streptomyces iconiensis]MDJ1131561.1 MFS transporter [Streptomyces iconiensis]
MGTEDEGHPRRWTILAAVCAALLVIVLDNTVLNVALPSLAADFAASTAEQQAVLDAYVVVFAGLLLPAGAASDRYGRRRAMLAGMAVLAVSSAAAAAAWSVWWLIAMRALMGVGAALVMPATLAILVQVFPERERPRAFAVWAAVASGAMAAGPVLGGALVAQWSWAGVFLLNVPVVGFAALAVGRLVPESRDPAARPVDGAGAGLVTLGMVALTTAVIKAGEHGFGTPVVPVAAAVAAGALAAFARRQRRVAAPLVDLSLYRDRRFAGASAAATLLTVGTGSSLFVLAQYLQLVRGYSAPEAGLALVPLAAGVVLGSAAGGRAHARLGARHAIALGFTVTAAGFCVLAALGPTSSYGVTATGLLLSGLGTGFAGPSTTSTVLGAVPRARAGMGSALNDTHQQLGIALGVAGLGALLSATYRGALPEAGSGSLGETLARTPALKDAAHTAFTHAQSATFLAAAACALLGALTATLTLRPAREGAAPAGA